MAVFCTYREGLDGPDCSVLVSCVLAAAVGRLELGRVGVGRHGNDDLDVVGGRTPLELTLRFDHVLDATVRVSLDHRLHPDERLHLNMHRSK